MPILLQWRRQLQKRWLQRPPACEQQKLEPPSWLGTLSLAKIWPRMPANSPPSEAGQWPHLTHSPPCCPPAQICTPSDSHWHLACLKVWRSQQCFYMHPVLRSIVPHLVSQRIGCRSSYRSKVVAQERVTWNRKRCSPVTSALCWESALNFAEGSGYSNVLKSGYGHAYILSISRVLTRTHILYSKEGLGHISRSLPPWHCQSQAIYLMYWVRPLQ